MSITVIIARDDVGAPTTREVYADGVKYSSDNGNLDIISAKPQLLATYGSGNWLSVHIDDSVEVMTTRSEDDDSGDDFSFGSDDDSSDSSDDESVEVSDDDGSDSSDDESVEVSDDDSSDSSSDESTEASDDESSL